MPQLTRRIGIILMLTGILALPAALIGWVCDDGALHVPFLMVSIPAILVGWILKRCIRSSTETTVGGATATALLAWVTFSLLAAMPFRMAGGEGFLESGFEQYINCLFEGTSAATSTGLTLVEDTSALPASFQFWRSICQWVGGLGVLVLAIAVVELGRADSIVYRATARRKTIDDDILQTTRAVWKVHITLTAFFFLLFGLLGMPWWEAFNHALTTTGTGGFTMNGSGIGGYGTTLQIATCFGMFVASISFVSHYRALFGGFFSSWIGTREHRVFYGILIAGSCLVALWDEAAGSLDRIFLWVSALTTTGFDTVSPTSFGILFLGLFIMPAMLVGAMAGSTAGGIKISRLVDLTNSIRHVFAGKGPRWKRRQWMALIISLSWLSAAALGSGILFLTADRSQHSFSDCLFEILSALGCVGLSSGVTSAELPLVPKLVLCCAMWLGRIELLSFFFGWVILRMREGKHSRTELKQES